MSDGRNDTATATTATSAGAAEATVLDATVLDAMVFDAVSLVCDPEYPDVTIAELGILESVSTAEDGSLVRIELVPTMLGCPALDVIRRDVAAAAQSACTGVEARIEVVFVADPLWTPDRIAPSAVDFMAREYSVAVRSSLADATCPICGNAALEHRSDFGPTPCRSVEWCPECRNPIEVVGRADLPTRTAAMVAAPVGTAAPVAAPVRTVPA
ncbi:metal-sulfur cluster assembly factor [Candidatus Poriferisodalis sp.]|uniref:metal-sulfur cluster assembly factor n=1 Tax=Candidatus Poriferisodalis sp. TaxID=3101277 RepID=UPI003B02B348